MFFGFTRDFCSSRVIIMAAWQPDQEKLSHVGHILEGCLDPSNHERHMAALNMLENAKKEVPDFGCYLMMVGAHREKHMVCNSERDILWPKPAS